jgi:hypothetical protein
MSLLIGAVLTGVALVIYGSLPIRVRECGVQSMLLVTMNDEKQATIYTTN